MVKVFSPTPENRARFVTEMQGQVVPRLVEADTIEGALDGADVVICATNALSPLFPGSMLTPGMHVSCVKPCELDDVTYQRAEPLIIHWREAKPIYNVLEVDPQTIPDVAEGFRHPLSRQVVDNWDDLPTLSQLINGAVPGRQDAHAITCFCNNVGIGLQFAAVGVEVLRRAREARVGRELPTEWFLESVHP